MTSLDELRQRTGHPLVGSFAFGDSPALADELLGFVLRGMKRATAGSLAEAQAGEEPVPAPGHQWGVLDGRGDLALVIETTHVDEGRMGDVTPAFAWDEGEYDRTLERWLDGHRQFFRRQGVEEPDDLVVQFERFRVVWPTPDPQPLWITPVVRTLHHDERPWLRESYRALHGTSRVQHGSESYDIADLPGLVYEVDGARVGVATFRPRSRGLLEPVTLDAIISGRPEVRSVLTHGLQEMHLSAW